MNLVLERYRRTTLKEESLYQEQRFFKTLSSLQFAKNQGRFQVASQHLLKNRIMIGRVFSCEIRQTAKQRQYHYAEIKTNSQKSVKRGLDVADITRKMLKISGTISRCCESCLYMLSGFLRTCPHVVQTIHRNFKIPNHTYISESSEKLAVLMLKGVAV